MLHWFVIDLTTKQWWDYLDHDLQELLLQAFDLLRVSSTLDSYRDYSFIVFPASKAYEGFLKKIFLDMGFITREDYDGTRFRIGKALNPSLEREARNGQWVYEKLEHYCNGKDLPDLLWTTWKECRNAVFHWFPKDARALTRDEAGERLNRVIYAIDSVFRECKIK